MTCCENLNGFSQIRWGKIFARTFVFLYIHNQCITQFLQESIWILAKSPEGESPREWILAEFLALEIPLRVQNEQFSEEKGLILRYTEKEV